MSKTVQILLIVGGSLLLLTATCVGAGAYWVSKNTGALKAEAESMGAEAEAYAADTDSQGCLDEAARRVREDDGMINEVRVAVFLRICLDSATPTPDFCEGVPAESEIMDSVKWRLEICEEMPEIERQHCSRLMQGWQRHCHPT